MNGPLDLPDHSWSLEDLTRSGGGLSWRRDWELAQHVWQRLSLERPEVAAHGDRVGGLAEEIAIEMGYSPHQAGCLRLAGRLHDAGKLMTPPDVLYHPGALDPQQRQIMTKHAGDGADLLLTNPPGELSLFLAEVAAHHHERTDGQGYHRLPGQSLSWATRMIAVADQADALLETRTYHQGFSPARTMAILASQDFPKSPWHGQHALDDKALGAWLRIMERRHGLTLAKAFAQEHLRPDGSSPRLHGSACGPDDSQPLPALK